MVDTALAMLPLQALTAGDLIDQSQKNQLRGFQSQNLQAETNLRKLQTAKAQNDAVIQRLSTTNDQASWQAGLDWAQANGIDTRGLPTTYDPTIKNQLMMSSLSTSDRLNLALKQQENMWKAEDRAYGRQKDDRDYDLKLRELNQKQGGGFTFDDGTPINGGFNPNSDISIMPNSGASRINGINPDAGSFELNGLGLTPFQRSQVMAESGGNPNAVSPKGARGLMQLMPGTQVDPGFGVEPARDNSPQENVRVGTQYQSAMEQRYGDPVLGLIAYNWGPGNTDKWLARGGNPAELPAETQTYVQRVMSGIPQQGAAAPAPQGVQMAELAPQTVTAESNMSAAQQMPQQPVKQGNNFVRAIYNQGKPLTDGLAEGQQWGVDTRSGARVAMDIPGYVSEDNRKLQQTIPAAIESSQQTLSLLDQLIGSEDGAVKAHPGLESSVGAKGLSGGLAGGWVVPGTDAADFNALLSQIGGKQFLEAFQSLKGGGAITEIEGRKAENAIARLQTSQSEKAFVNAAKELRQVVKSAIDRQNKKLGNTSPATAPTQTQDAIDYTEYFK